MSVGWWWRKFRKKDLCRQASLSYTHEKKYRTFSQFLYFKVLFGVHLFPKLSKKKSSFIFLELQYLCRLTPSLNCSHSIHSRHSWYFDLFLAKLGRKYLNHCMEILIKKKIKAVVNDGKFTWLGNAALLRTPMEIKRLFFHFKTSFTITYS